MPLDGAVGVARDKVVLDPELAAPRVDVPVNVVQVRPDDISGVDAALRRYSEGVRIQQHGLFAANARDEDRQLVVDSLDMAILEG